MSPTTCLFYTRYYRLSSSCLTFTPLLPLVAFRLAWHRLQALPNSPDVINATRTHTDDVGEALVESFYLQTNTRISALALP